MNKRLVRIISSALAAVLVVSGVIIGVRPAYADVSTDSTVQSLEAELSFLEQKQIDLQNQLTSNETDIYNQEIYSQQIESLIQTVQSKIEVANELVVTLEANRAELEIEIAEAEDHYTKTFDAFLDYMRLMYEDGEVSYLGLIFGSDSLTEFLSNIDRANALLAYNKKLMSEYQSAKADFENKKKECDLAIDMQTSAIASLNQTINENYMLLSNSKAYLSYLKGQQSEMISQLAEAQAAWEEANRELEEYLAELAKKTAQKYSGNGFIWPIDPTIGNYLTSRFGARYIAEWDWWDPGHGAIDIAGSYIYGKEIIASAPGEVVFATNAGTSSYGNYIMIDHGYDGNGYDIVTLYAHCSSVCVTAGQYVNQGDVIGYVGSTGNSTGPHLHFEYRKNGVRCDPLEYVNMPDNIIDISG